MRAILINRLRKSRGQNRARIEFNSDEHLPDISFFAAAGAVYRRL